jgi:hypothetical protein
MTQPKTCSCPFARNSGFRDTERNGSLIKRKTTEKPEFNNSALALIELCQTIKGVIQENQIHAPLMRQADRLIQLKFADSSAPLSGPDFSCTVNQDLAHQTRSHSEEMRAILPVGRLLPDHSQVRFMNQSCTLKALPRGFATKMTSRQTPQLVIHERDQLFQSSVVAVSPPDQQFTYVRMRNCAVISHSQEPPGDREARCGRRIVLQIRQVKDIRLNRIVLTTTDRKQINDSEVSERLFSAIHEMALTK